ncbi:MAG TPA: hypothetical protein VNR86_09005 [Sphingomicrobium sp.]|nr:hypothetical protein [Sphingomicrobium sp.]
MFKLLLILILGGALANGLARTKAEPPLLIDSSPAPFTASR